MELREYVAVLQRRWPIVAALTILTLLVSGVFALRGPKAYEATVRMTVSVGNPAVGAPPEAEAPPYVYQRDYYQWLASEYLADDLSEIIQSDAFTARVSSRINEEVTKADIRDVTRVRKTHRILDITIQAARPDLAQRVMAGIIQEIQQNGGLYLAELASNRGQIVAIDDTQVKSATTTRSLAADLGLRGALGLFAGLVLAFIVDYLDSTVRSPREVERILGLPVLGEIPALGR
ncbi:MAG TPA: Wzz/FepE/Etk N-terminal domain-containing protein [Chloroflexota bacterium]